jgi:hypothetical protein
MGAAAKWTSGGGRRLVMCLSKHVAASVVGRRGIVGGQKTLMSQAMRVVIME